MLSKDYVVSLRQGTHQLYLKQKAAQGWAFTITDAGIFGYNEAVKLADKQKERFTELNKLTVAPPAGYMHITICEIDSNVQILMSHDVLLPERVV